MPSRHRLRRSHAIELTDPSVPLSSVETSLPPPRATSRLIRAAPSTDNIASRPTIIAASPFLPRTSLTRSPSTRRRLPYSRAHRPPRAATPNLTRNSLQRYPLDWFTSERFMTTGVSNLDVSVSYTSGSDQRVGSVVPATQNLSISAEDTASARNTPTATRTLRKSVLTKTCSLTPQLPLPVAELECLEDLSTTAFWTVSSAKAGSGIENLLDDRLDTFWQSDGGTPHFINVQFLQRTAISYICIYCDVKVDESYTPHKLSIRTGNYVLDLEEMMQYELSEPKGWEMIKLPNEPWGAPHRCFIMQIAILSNHQQGRDSHFRQIKILSNKEQSKMSASVPSFEQHKSPKPVEAVRDPVLPNAPLLIGPLPTSLPANRWVVR